MREHCYYCDKALYKMYLQDGVYSHKDDTDVYENSKGERICLKCNDRLIRKGDEVACSSCDKPIYTFKRDLFRERQIRPSDLQGIEPQRSPIEGVKERCTHCRSIVKWG